jgi:hypothetical protein
MPRHQTTKQGDKKSAASCGHVVRQHVHEGGKQSLASLHILVGDILKLREHIP